MKDPRNYTLEDQKAENDLARAREPLLHPRGNYSNDADFQNRISALKNQLAAGKAVTAADLDSISNQAHRTSESVFYPNDPNNRNADLNNPNNRNVDPNNPNNRNVTGQPGTTRPNEPGFPTR